MKKDKQTEKHIKNWETHWKRISKKESLFGKLLTVYRKLILASAVRRYTEKYFAREGLFLECGSGTSQTSVKLALHKRKYVAIDFSEDALREAKKIPQIKEAVNANIMELPYKNESVDGIWNLGVMEHFSKTDIQKILTEFKRVLKDDGVMLLFWPVTYSPAHIFFESVIRIGGVFGKKIRFFPDEPSILHSKKEAREHMEKSGLYSKEFFNYHDGFTHIVIVGKKIPFAK